MRTEVNQKARQTIPPRRYLAIMLTIGIGVAASTILFIIVRNWERDHQRIGFELIAKGYANAVQNSLSRNVEALMFLKDFFDNSTNVNRHEFSSYINSVLPRYPGIQAFSWNPLVRDNERAEFVNLLRKEGFEGFEVTERTVGKKLVRAAQRQEYVIVKFIEPLETNRPALGFDIASNPTRLKAIVNGFRTGKLSATDRITLVQETGNQFGILLLLPIYQQGEVLKTVQDRYQYRKGFVVEVLRIGDAVEAALKGFPDMGISLSLFDLSADAENRFLYHRPAHRSDRTKPPIEAEIIENGLYWEKVFDFGERQYKLRFSSPFYHHDSRQLWQSWAVLFGSLLLTFMMAFYLLKRLMYTAEIERKVRQEMQTNKQLAAEISERKRAEAKATHFGHILERSLNEIYVFNAQTLKLLQVNRGARENLGYSIDEIQHLTPLDLEPEFTRESFLKRLEPLRKGTKSVIIYTTVHQRKDASVYPVEVHLQYVAFDSTPVFVALVIDISEKLKMEDKLRQSQKMEAIGTLAGGIAHDFNNILSAIIGYTELAITDGEKGGLSNHHLVKVLRAGERAKNLVKQILTFSRQAQQERQPVQIKPIVKEALKFLRASLPASIEIRQDIQSDALVIADPTQIYQVIMNLCTNAGHAMRENGGVLEVKLIDVDVGTDWLDDHPELKPGTYQELTVSDTGHGIPSPIMDRIFDPFFTTKKTGEGTGMGLSVVHGIVSSCSGTVKAHSRQGKGSTFSVYLPVIDRQLQHPAMAEEPVPTGTERILFVDDEPALVEIGKRTLVRLGYQVITQTSSLDALALFTANPDQFDLVITDMSMPKMSGDVLSAELMKVRPEIPVILCTGYSSTISDETVKQIGIKAFAHKPIAMNDLAKTIRKVLAEAKATN